VTAGRVRRRTTAAVVGGAAALLLLGSSPAAAIPSFARQTRLPCSACHTQFPELTEMGRSFKLNGYVLRSIDAVEVADSAGHQELLLNLPSILSMMFQASATTTAHSMPGAKNFSVFLPDQLSLFLAGEIGPKLGAFVQVTMDPQSGTLGIDNTELRYATQTHLAGKSATVGLSVNNNPAISDLWNTTPVWGFPFSSSAIGPTPAAAAAIDGVLGQKVAGLAAFAFINNTVYAEFGGYRASPIGAAQPLTADSAVTGVVRGIAPYWRVALTKGWGNDILMVGTYGLAERQYPGGGAPLTGLTDGFLDIAADAQFMRSYGKDSFTLAATWIHERQNLDATFAAGGAAAASHTLNTFRGRITYHGGQRYGLTLAPFIISGDADATLRAPASVTGSVTGSPNSSGIIAEADFMPWQNVRLSAQYTMYGKFNGRSTDYDGSGRNASWNNTLYVSMWLMY
jgi:hypothetical protein